MNLYTMYHTRKLIGLFTLGLLLSITSCREEESVLIEGPQEKTLKANSNIANLLKNTASKDGSDDNIIDLASCISLQLPVTVQANGIEVVVAISDDFQTIEDIFDEFEDDIDVIEIAFPITIILPDFTTIVIADTEELNDFASECPGENEFDDDIECADIKFPVTASVFNSSNEVIDTITLSNDEELFEFIDDLEEEDLVNVNFPITVILFDGSEVPAADLDELENILDNARDDCDEDDDNDYNDDDCDNCTTELLGNALTGCTDWRVDKLERNDQNLEDLYTTYLFNFMSDGTVSVSSDSGAFSGTWTSSGTGNNIAVDISITNLPDFNAIWNLHEIDEDPQETDVDLRMGDDRLRFESDCISGGDSGNNDGGGDLGSVITDGIWIVDTYLDNAIDQTMNFAGYVFNFEADGSVTADNGSSTVGSWAAQNGDSTFSLDFGATMPLDEFNDNWDVISVTDTQIELRDVSGGDGGVDTLIFIKQ